MLRKKQKLSASGEIFNIMSPRWGFDCFWCMECYQYAAPIGAFRNGVLRVIL